MAALPAEVKAWHMLVDFSYEKGKPGRAICHVSRQWGADLIVVVEQPKG